jgi:hypothetical protein
MTMIEIEQRLTSLEQGLAELRAELARRQNGSEANGGQVLPSAEELIPDAEYPLVLSVPPKQEFELRARIVSIERGPQDLALSDAEWADLQQEAGNE